MLHYDLCRQATKFKSFSTFISFIRKPWRDFTNQITNHKNTEHKIFLPGTSALALGVMQINQTCEEKQINQDDSKQNDKEIIEDFTNEPTPIDKPLSHSTQR